MKNLYHFVNLYLSHQLTLGSDYDLVINFLTALKAAGFAIIVDDFFRWVGIGKSQDKLIVIDKMTLSDKDKVILNKILFEFAR